MVVRTPGRFSHPSESAGIQMSGRTWMICWGITSRTGIAVDKQTALGSLRNLGALGNRRPVDIANFNRIDSMPFAIGGLLGTIAVAVMAHTLLTSIRRRRRRT